MSCPHQDDAARWLLGELEGDEVALHIAGCPACAALADAYVAVLSVAVPACADEAATLAWLYGEEDDAAGVHAATCPACARLVRAHSDALTAVAPVVPALRAPALPAPGGAPEAASAVSASGRRWRGWIALAAAAALMLALAQTSVVPSSDLSGARDLSPTAGMASSASVLGPVAAPATAASPAARPALASATAASVTPAPASAARPVGFGPPRAAPSTPRPHPARRGPRLASSRAAHPAGSLPVAVLADDVDLDRRLDALSAELAAFASDPSLL